MNKRIIELTIEANKYATKKYPIPSDADAITKEILVGNRIGESHKKFAELIVQECAAVIEEQYVNPGFKMCMSWAVKQHFGVEE